MTDDKLLNQIAQVARREAARSDIDTDWDRYSAGDLTDEELQQLIDRHEPHKAREIEAAFRPLSDDFQVELLDKVDAQLKETSQSDTKEQHSSSTPIDLESRRVRSFMPLAIAATLMLAFGAVFFSQHSPSYTPIANYSATLLGGSEYRSADTPIETAVYRAGDRVEFRLTPDTRVETDANEALDYRVMAKRLDVTGQKTNTQWLPELDIQTASSGATRIVGTIGKEILLIPGDYYIYVAMGRKEAIPDTQAIEQVLSTEQGATGNGWQAWRFDVVIKTL